MCTHGWQWRNLLLLFVVSVAKCRHHVVGQRVVSDISLIRSCWRTVTRVQNLIILICYACSLLSRTFIVLHIPNILALQHGGDAACTWWPSIRTLKKKHGTDRWRRCRKRRKRRLTRMRKWRRRDTLVVPPWWSPRWRYTVSPPTVCRPEHQTPPDQTCQIYRESTEWCLP